MLSFIAELLYPGICLGCERQPGPPDIQGTFLLPHGWPPEAVTFFRTEFSFRLLRSIDVPSRVLCRDCWLSLLPAPDAAFLDESRTIPLVTPFLTNPLLLDLVRFLKFGRGRAVAPPLSWWLACTLSRYFGESRTRLSDDTVLVPVPLHPERKRSRGYNQSFLLAGGVASILQLEADGSILLRKRKTKPQSTLCPDERRANVRGAFSSAGPDRVAGRNIILVDDLVTTGETARACIEALQSCGPSGIIVLAAGRGA